MTTPRALKATSAAPSMRNVWGETWTGLTQLEQRQARAALDSAGFEVGSHKDRDALWLEVTPTLWLWAKALRGLSS